MSNYAFHVQQHNMVVSSNACSSFLLLLNANKSVKLLPACLVNLGLSADECECTQQGNCLALDRKAKHRNNLNLVCVELVLSRFPVHVAQIFKCM